MKRITKTLSTISRALAGLTRRLSEKLSTLSETVQILTNLATNTHLQKTYGILKRTANSIIADAQGQLNALKELKAHEQKQLAHKIKVLEANIHALEVGKSALKTG